jgi:hypothetical protein
VAFFQAEIYFFSGSDAGMAAGMAADASAAGADTAGAGAATGAGAGAGSSFFPQAARAAAAISAAKTRVLFICIDLKIKG